MFSLKRIPTHPGEILKEEFLLPLNISPNQLSEETSIPIEVINGILNETGSINPEIGVVFSIYFGTSPELWLNLQNQYDIYKIMSEKSLKIKSIKSYKQLHKEFKFT